MFIMKSVLFISVEKIGLLRIDSINWAYPARSVGCAKDWPGNIPPPKRLNGLDCAVVLDCGAEKEGVEEVIPPVGVVCAGVLVVTAGAGVGAVVEGAAAGADVAGAAAGGARERTICTAEPSVIPKEIEFIDNREVFFRPTIFKDKKPIVLRDRQHRNAVKRRKNKFRLTCQ